MPQKKLWNLLLVSSYSTVELLHCICLTPEAMVFPLRDKNPCYRPWISEQSASHVLSKSYFKSLHMLSSGKSFLFWEIVLINISPSYNFRGQDKTERYKSYWEEKGRYSFPICWIDTAHCYYHPEDYISFQCFQALWKSNHDGIGRGGNHA